MLQSKKDFPAKPSYRETSFLALRKNIFSFFAYPTKLRKVFYKIELAVVAVLVFVQVQLKMYQVGTAYPGEHINQA